MLKNQKKKKNIENCRERYIAYARKMLNPYFIQIYLYRNSDINNNSLVFIIVAAKDLDYQKFEVAVTG